MLRLAIAVTACILAMVPAPAMGASIGLSAPGMGANDWSEEPNTLAPGTVPSNFYDDPSAAYPADDNGIAEAKEGIVPVPVLQGKWTSYQYPVGLAGGTLTGVGLSGLATVDASNLMRSLTGQSMMFAPGIQTFTAFYGEWADYNKDQIRDDEGHWRNSVDGHDRPIYIRGNSNDECQEQDAEVGADGETHLFGGESGNTIPVPVTVPARVEKRCTTEDEWSPPAGWDPAGAGNPEVVSYVTPGPVWSRSFWTGDYVGWSGPILSRPCPVPGLEGDEQDCEGTETQQGPDITYTPGDFYGQGTYSWEGVFDVGFDGSLLETKVVETISEPIHSLDGPRSHEPGPDSLVDTDVYVSVNPAVETLFQNNVHSAEAMWNDQVAGFEGPARDVWVAWNETNNDVDEALGDLLGDAACTACTTNPIVGGVNAEVNGRRAKETPAADHTEGFHLYLDLQMRDAVRVPLIVTATGVTYGVCTGEADNCGPATRLIVNGNFGAWHDANADTWIGEPEAADGCEDVYDCGSTRDPNVYTEAASNGEFIPTCAPGRSGAFQVTLTPDGGRWGENGAYVDYDEGSNVESTQGGRASFNNYDDYALDVADDGEIDRLIMSGPIRLWMTCTDNSGAYGSFENVWLLDGRTYGITMASDAVTMAFTEAGISLPESVSDTDHLDAMTIGP